MTLAELMEQNHEIGFEKGLKQGLAEGHSKSKLQIAKNMEAKGFDFSVIEELTGISEDQL